MTDAAVFAKARELVTLLRAKKLVVATAESCTGGLVAAALTDIPGSSDIFDRGFVTYSNAAKEEALGVPAQIIREHGAVSAQTARAMAVGALAHSNAEIAVAVTGIAGPDGGSDEKPVGLVHFACARKGGAVTHVERRFGPLSREAIRTAATLTALDLFTAQTRP
jgi:nicotinamide-nucleotide amidase